MQQPLLASELPGLTRVATRLANAWLVDAPGGWVLVDTGGPGYAGRIVHHAERRYGRGTRPHAIVLTHGHVDHAGSAARLAHLWKVPVFAHRREIPYLDGRATYRCSGPDAGGMLAALSRALPLRRHALRGPLRPLPLDGHVPALPGWRWVRTPGHTPGHVSLLRTSDRVVVAGDALPGVGLAVLASASRGLRESVRTLMALEPTAIAGGHGLPLAGPALPVYLRALAGAGLPAREAAPADGRPRSERVAAVGLLALGASVVLRTFRRFPADA